MPSRARRRERSTHRCSIALPLIGGYAADAVPSGKPGLDRCVEYVVGQGVDLARCGGKLGR
jgi:hypothetical protein